jgi:hypothetical protein
MHQLTSIMCFRIIAHAATRGPGHSRVWVLALAACWCGVIGPAVLAQTSQPSGRVAAAVGEVTADDVYVRSGPSLNHYTVTKLKAGDRVQVVGETSEWFEILPTPDVFSLISGDYVDVSPDGARGVVSGNNVRVRAGSLLNDNMYTIQTLLSRGAEVSVLGRNPDGFLRIVPPADATLFVSRSFVQVVPEELIRLERETGRPVSPDARSDSGTDFPVGATTGQTASDDRSDSDRGDRPATAARVQDSSFAGMPSTDQRRALEKIDEDARQEMAKPLIERRLQPLIDRYAVIAAQDDDELAKLYADARIRQLSDVASLLETVRTMRRASEQSESARRQFLQERAALRTVVPPVPSGLDAQGELRESALYPPTRTPRRLRLVDSTGEIERTIGYVEIPTDFGQPIEKYIGKFIGIRAVAKNWLEGGVEPVPVYVAGELVLLDKREASPGDITQPEAGPKTDIDGARSDLKESTGNESSGL